MFGEVSDHQEEGFYPLELRGLLILNKSLTTATSIANNTCFQYPIYYLILVYICDKGFRISNNSNVIYKAWF